MKAKKAPIPQLVKIVDLGSDGDGIALNEAHDKIFVPFGLPQDEMLVAKHKGWVEVLEHKKLSPLRDTPICPLSGICGGCSLPELGRTHYLKFKEDLVKQTLSLSHLEAEATEPVFSPQTLGTRRRASFTYRLRDKMEMGFNRKNSHWVQDMQTCPLLCSEINNLLAPLKKFLTELGCKKGSLNITVTTGGIDILINDAIAKELNNFELIASFANTYNIARISDKFGTPLIELRKPYMDFNSNFIDFPPSAFSQPSVLGENFIREKICTYIEKYSPTKVENLADLFCGLGTFSFALSQYGKVYAADDNKNTTANFARFVQDNHLNLTVQNRNLFTNPLTPEELKKFDILVLDPPRAGALEQIKNIANTSKHFLIIYVSCNEATFGRDGKILQDAGYKLLNLSPLDQFPFTPHIELIGIFKR
jgi:23S rRNA (uracil1939-C5)-methyltransferase